MPLEGARVMEPGRAPQGDVWGAAGRDSGRQAHMELIPLASIAPTAEVAASHAGWLGLGRLEAAPHQRAHRVEMEPSPPLCGACSPYDHVNPAVPHDERPVRRWEKQGDAIAPCPSRAVGPV